MEKIYKKELPEYPDNDLLSLIRNPKSLDNTRFSEIIEELKKRGYSDEINKVEKNLIKLNPIYSKFWNRVGAFFIDIIVLALLGFILGLFLKDTFVQLGSQALLIGFIISLVYFGLGNSLIFKGQTLGKKILKLRVVDKNLDTISLQKSLLRTLIYTVPYFFLNYGLNGSTQFSTLFIAKEIILLSFLIILPIHFIINSSTRQAIHDLILKTYVVELEAYPGQQLKKSRFSPIIYSGIVLIVLITLFIFFNLQNRNLIETAKKLVPISEQIDRNNEVQNSSISQNFSTVRKLGSDENISKTNSLVLDIELNKNLISDINPEDIAELAFVKDAVKIILKDVPNAKRFDFIQVNLIYGYNIGIYKSSNSMTVSNTIENWEQKIK
jgi:uncharacterized RDD family membrane protein YckC